MNLEPRAFVFYVSNLEVSKHFYHNLFTIAPKIHSPSYVSFQLSNGMIIGLKDKATVNLNITEHNSGELAFIAIEQAQVEAIALSWQQKGMHILEKPTMASFGYTFVAADPDGNRLRVLSLI